LGELLDGGIFLEYGRVVGIAMEVLVFPVAVSILSDGGESYTLEPFDVRDGGEMVLVIDDIVNQSPV
tara:strand:+ start:27 stop:227 length:201 start_codon:yes stop_codon:yes gene_type:complete